MNFREGLLYTYQNRQTDGEITDPFYLYCRLSDLCAGSYVDKEKVELFHAIDKRLCVFEKLIEEGEKGKEELLNSYMVVSDLLNEGSFIKLIECAVWVMDPNSRPPVAVQKQPQAAPKRPRKKAQPVVVNYAEESKENEKRTTLKMPSYNVFWDDEVTIFLGVGLILLALTLLVGLFGILVGICKWNIPWLAWQWIIGIVGGGWIALLLGFLTYLLEDSVTCDYTVFGFICVVVVAVINFVLLIFLRENYKVLFGCISAWAILGGGVLSAICFDDVEDGWGWVYVFAAIILLLGMIASLIWL